MANAVYTPSNIPATRASLASSPVRSEFALIEAGIDKIIPVSSFAGHANKFLKVNNGETSMELVAAEGWLDGQTHVLPVVRESTWTPVLTSASPGTLSVGAYTTQLGHYWRNGQVVFIEMEVNASPTLGTASGNLRITGLPFVAHASRAFAQLHCQIFGNASITWPTGTQTLYGIIDATEQFIKIQANGPGTNQGYQIDDLDDGSVTRIRISGHYYTDAN